MLNVFRKKPTVVSCHFCKKEVDKKSTFVLQYKAIDGIGMMDVCLECASYMNNIIDTWESLNEKND